MPSERSHTYMDIATAHHLETGPRGQPWWCCPLFAQPNDHMATQYHYLHTSRASYKEPHSSPFVPAQFVDTYTYPWPGDPKLRMETSPGFVPYTGWIWEVGSAFLTTGKYLWDSLCWNHTAIVFISNDHHTFWNVDLTGGTRCSCFPLKSFNPWLQHNDCCCNSSSATLTAPTATTSKPYFCSCPANGHHMDIAIHHHLDTG